ncbi:MAG TPA: ArsR family transcriptional regulator [Longimicrobiales bacterium]|nr:ArsR family transcriptional regulator [Longimicrobiales bacterium]
MGTWILRATRRRIIEQLRWEPLTISQLGERLELTASAVRVHVSALERQGFVQRAGVARSTNRPAAIYELAPGVDELMCSAYVPFVATLLRAMSDSLESARVAALMHEVGRGLATSFSSPTGTLPERAHVASDLLNELGALTEVEADAGGLRIRGHDCPLAAAVTGSASVCRAMESFVSELVRAPVRECCERGGRPRCCFEIELR